MSVTPNSVRFEMFLDEQTYAAFTLGHTPWRSPDAAPWECPGIEPTIFSEGYVPFKYCSADHSIARSWFDQAARKGKAQEARYLLEGEIEIGAFVQHQLAGKIVIMPLVETIAFYELITDDNYPGLMTMTFRSL